MAASRFPEAELRDVEGLVKLVDQDELEANDWSLTPGRYVGVAPEEEDEDFDFEEALRDIHIEIDGLNAEAAELAANYQGKLRRDYWMTWDTAKVGDLLEKVKRPGKLQKADYQRAGAFPVIDQGVSRIAGYSDNTDIVLYTPLPITIFGDHTRRVKLAREPFICGADGTQLLYPNTDAIDPEFFLLRNKKYRPFKLFLCEALKVFKRSENLFSGFGDTKTNRSYSFCLR